MGRGRNGANIDGVRRRLQNSAVSARDATFLYEPPQQVMRFAWLNVAHPGGPFSNYAVSADPKRMLVFQRVPTETFAAAASTGSSTGADPTSGLIVARHWERSLTKR